MDCFLALAIDNRVSDTRLPVAEKGGWSMKGGGGQGAWREEGCLFCLELGEITW